MSTRSAASNPTHDAAPQQTETRPDGCAPVAVASKRLPGDERRRRILEAVRLVSSERGVSHLSVSAVTEQADIADVLY